MFTSIFFTIIRVYLVPAFAIFTLSSTVVGYQMGFLGVNIALTVILIPMIIWQCIKVVPNLALIRTKNVMKLVVQIVMEVIAIIGFWSTYASIFP